MPNGTDNELAQAVYLAQLYAARNTCKCKACQLLRQASDSLMDQMLKGKPVLTPPARTKGKKLTELEISPDISTEGEEEL